MIFFRQIKYSTRQSKGQYARLAFMDMDKEARPWDLLRTDIEHVPDDIQNARLKACHSCEMYIKVPGVCIKCGCLMNLKTKLPHAYCPIDKWGKYSSA
jgi:rRNA maturation protein Nop10